MTYKSLVKRLEQDLTEQEIDKIPCVLSRWGLPLLPLCSFVTANDQEITIPYFFTVI